MNARWRRAGWIGGGLVAIALACAFVLNAFRANVVFFVSPSQIDARMSDTTRAFRLGGMVERGSLRRDADGLTVHFVVTDNVRQIGVVYRGLLPDLFREGSGVVAQGTLGADGQFHADQVLAKHDEKYTPPDLRNLNSHGLAAAPRAATGGGS
ncbi:cytochrome c maturation protein CcmE [Paraburkholderia dinghuensis]|uniref:Cytochrome c-type biogenesis protein CcmE n=1 Tax=Paraburkholderia dinghuensis TaxID=2305225 RepID=A0A3N6NTB8_9BURK|nr:cytochrome c maturation protein CcmE [Paraburkholderia dinghuensis]RQH03633.1 cytochrome c maturation protein CcmE [Paraburkholderia dinghuensis]